MAYQAGILAYKVSGACEGLGVVSTNESLAALRQVCCHEGPVLLVHFNLIDFGSLME